MFSNPSLPHYYFFGKILGFVAGRIINCQLSDLFFLNQLSDLFLHLGLLQTSLDPSNLYSW